MNEGFFSLSELASSTPKIPHSSRCGLCGLYRKCKTPKMKTYGHGRKGILIVSESPGKHEDEIGHPLSGKTNMHLEGGFDAIDIDLKRDCWRTNAVICRPVRDKPPESKQIQACLPNLKRTIDKLQPTVILLMGKAAVESFMSMIGMTGYGFGIGQWINWNIPLQELNCWICIAHNPSYLMHLDSEVADREFQRTLEACKKLSKSRPWKTVPNYKDSIELLYNSRHIKQNIKEIIQKDGTIAFDYEATCLKPEYTGAEIVSCSVCWKGKKTIAYPWNSENADSTRHLLRSPIKKVGANIKFEQRWTKFFLKINVRNWVHDTMLFAHVLDYRGGITSLTFQSFVRLGLLPYDEHIKPLLQSVDNSHLNRIKEIPLKDLLEYNGLDSHTCYNIYMLQRKEL